MDKGTNEATTPVEVDGGEGHEVDYGQPIEDDA